MGAATLGSVEDYLSTSYSPDREYIDGRSVERNLGRKRLSLHRGSLQRRHPGLHAGKIDDYLGFGVAYVWIINPRLRKGCVVTRAGMVEAQSAVLTTNDPAIRVPVSELFDID
jgi:hypothetical protein